MPETTSAESAAPIRVRSVYPTHSNGELAEWYFDEGSGDRVRDILNSDGARDIVFDEAFLTAFNSYPEWTRRGLLLRGDMVRTPVIPAMREVAVLYRVKRDSAGFILAGGFDPGAGMLGSAVSSQYSWQIASPQGEIVPLSYAATAGNQAYRLNRGGYVLVFMDFQQAYNTQLGIGGRATQADPIAGLRSPELEMVWLKAWDKTLNADDRDEVFAGVRRIGADREVYLHWRDCPDWINCVPFWGQSGLTSYSEIDGMLSGQGQASWGLTEKQKLRTVFPGVMISQMNTNGNHSAMPSDYVFGLNHRIGFEDRYVGPNFGAALAFEAARVTMERKFLMNQSAIDSTVLAYPAVWPHDEPLPANVPGASPGAVRPDNESWSARASKNGIFWQALNHWWDTEQRLLLQGVGPRVRSLWYFQGEEDCQYVDWANDYGSEIQFLWDTAKLHFGSADMTMRVLKTPRLGPREVAGFDYAASDIVRQAQIDFAAVNGDVELIATDDLIPLQTWDQHFTAQSLVTSGQRFFAATDFSTDGVRVLPAPDYEAAVAALFSGGEQGGWYDPSDLTTMWQDAAGTTPAVVDGPVGRINDKSGRGSHLTQANGANRPTLRLVEGRYSLQFNGAQFLTGSMNLSASSLLTAAHASMRTSNALAGDVMNHNGTTAPYFSMSSPPANGVDRSRIFVNGSTFAQALMNPDLGNNVRAVQVGTVASVIPFVELRVNGAVAASTTTNPGVTAFSNNQFALGSRGGGVYFTGHIYGAIVRGAYTANPTGLETFLAGKAGTT